VDLKSKEGEDLGRGKGKGKKKKENAAFYFNPLSDRKESDFEAVRKGGHFD
jgi:hypothetical protein